MKLGKKLTHVFDFLTEVLAPVTIALIAFLYLNANFDFITDANTISLLASLREYLIVATLICAGLEFAVKRSFLFFILFCALSAICVVFMFFPDSVPTFLQGIVL